jgi:hypothetical protein
MRKDNDNWQYTMTVAMIQYRNIRFVWVKGHKNVVWGIGHKFQDR